MIDRSYLPFQSARDYQDRKMAKWMGFFLSEHTNSLDQDRKTIDITSDLSLSEKYLLLGQAYSQQLPIWLSIFQDNQMSEIEGRISEIQPKQFQVKINNYYRTFPMASLIRIEMEEENRNHDETSV
ncbi:hypothetical protein MKY69_05330 [Streptococcus sp. FSL R7-0212]|uniref:hypothetical protein n=1 Tax=Streptococcus sp. FSL R7-0212 TaxID=2921726 RepID=UPI0030F61D80